MARIHAPLVRQASTTTGTGDYTMSGTVTGHVPFSGRCAVGDTFRYMAREVDGSGNPTGAYEHGTGTYSAANTITRTAVLHSSNADAAVNWAAGTRIIDIISWVDAILGQNVESIDFVQVTNTKPLPVDADKMMLLNSENDDEPVLVTKGELLAVVSAAIAALDVRVTALEPATAPAAFTAGQWTAEPTVTPGQIGFNLTALPGDGGSAITALEYRVGSAAAIAFTGTGTGLRVVTAGLTAGTAVDLQVRAVNAVGAGAWSDVKNRTPLAAGSGLPSEPLQRTPVAYGNYADAVATFPAPVTEGNTIIIKGGAQTGVPSVTSNRAGTVSLNSYDLFGGGRPVLGCILGAGAGETTLTMTGAERQSFYAEEWPAIVLDSAGLGQTPPENFGAATATTPNPTSVAATISFSAWAIRTGVVQPGAGIATGFTEGGRYVGPNTFAQFVGGYRIDSTVGVKSAVWPAATEGLTEGQGALILTFRAP